MLNFSLLCGVAGEYFVATDGIDTNPGTADLPWLTIQKAANTVSAGDTVTVRPGHYAERVSTTRSGDVTNRIEFRAEGVVIMLGWRINHAHVTVRGFEITGWSATGVLNAHVEVTTAGSFFHLEDCVVRDGLYLVRPDVSFHAQSNSITTATGGFLDAGFQPGQTIGVGAATNGISPVSGNHGTHLLLDVTDNTLIVASSLVDQGPLPVYISGSYVYGLVLRPGTEGCIIRNNTFRNLGYDAWYVSGHSQLFEGNILEQGNGWDVMHFGGTNNVFRGNLIRNSPLVVYHPSPDVWESGNVLPYRNILFTNNMIIGFAGVQAAQKGSPPTGFGLVYTRNVFVDVGPFIGTHPNTTFEHNTFLRVAKTNTPVTSILRHPLRFETQAGATNITLRNNLFVDCGQTSTRIPEAEVGWYQFGGPTNSVTTEGNFVAGAPPDFAAKTNWLENPTLNGGDPGFVNPNDPLGPDGIPFTEDDGLRLLPTSKLGGAGNGGGTPGAYEFKSSSQASLSIFRAVDEIVVTWPESLEAWILQSADGLGGSWQPFPGSPALNEGWWTVLVAATNAAQYFRLQR
jgi:hypothetical protein